MKCKCGLIEFSHCGWQEFKPDADGKQRKPLQLVNCCGCGATLSVPEYKIEHYASGEKPMIGDEIQFSHHYTPIREQIVVNIQGNFLYYSIYANGKKEEFMGMNTPISFNLIKRAEKLEGRE